MSYQWLLFLPQLPSSPSSLRVLVWRRLQTIGALGIQNGVWMLPVSDETRRFLEDLVSEVEPQGGRGLIFTASSTNEASDAEIVQRFRADRDQEYVEFCDRCQDFLKEIEKETGARKFIFAELEENERDLHRLSEWFQKIQARDFFGGQQAGIATAALDACRQALHDFTQSVYQQAGLNMANDEESEISHDESG